LPTLFPYVRFSAQPLPIVDEIIFEFDLQSTKSASHINALCAINIFD